MLDERGKKVWELLICDETRSFEHAEFFPNNRINSVELAKAIERVIVAQGARPRRFKFFRSQMQTIITRACNDVGVDPLPSRRCQTLTTWLDWRVENVYKNDPGWDGAASPMMGFEASAPRPLPDALRGESWAFVALPLVGVKEEAEQVRANKVFGDLLEIDPNLPDDTLVPGIAVYTRRAAALAGWTKGLELGGISVDLDMGTLILDTGVSDVSSVRTALKLEYVSSYEHFGVVRLECVSGCVCDATRVSAHVVDRAEGSPIRDVELDVTPSAECVVRITLLEETDSGEHYFKVLAMQSEWRPGAVKDDGARRLLGEVAWLRELAT